MYKKFLSVLIVGLSLISHSPLKASDDDALTREEQFQYKAQIAVDGVMNYMRSASQIGLVCADISDAIGFGEMGSYLRTVAVTTLLGVESVRYIFQFSGEEGSVTRKIYSYSRDASIASGVSLLSQLIYLGGELNKVDYFTKALVYLYGISEPLNAVRDLDKEARKLG